MIGSNGKGLDGHRCAFIPKQKIKIERLVAYSVEPANAQLTQISKFSKQNGRSKTALIQTLHLLNTYVGFIAVNKVNWGIRMVISPYRTILPFKQ
ncbi:MAG TPA: hypothetical protein DCM48_04670 [Thalassospira sp.]|nr:hypothetical protein [Thalassospira sp.]